MELFIKTIGFQTSILICRNYYSDIQLIILYFLKMRNLFLSNTKSSFSRGILTLMVGGVFLFFPGMTMKTVMIIIGILLLLSGLITLIISNWKKRGAIKGFWSAQGIMNMLLGLLFITSPEVMIKIFMILVGIILLIMGLLQLTGAFGMLKRSAWAWIFFLIGGLTLGSGVFLLSDPFKSAEALLPFLGAIMMLNGASQIVMAWKVGHQPQTYKGSAVQDIPFEEV
jgi:uncharacterized membrane protein HdeD (DUF308 family)